MKKIKFLFLLMLSFFTAVVVACDTDNPTENPTVVTESISLDKTSVTMDLYETMTITATLNNLTGDVLWQSSDETKAKVVNGVVTALSEGNVTITATVGEIKSTCEVKIVSSGEIPTLLLDKGNSTIQVGNELTIQPTLRYKNNVLNAEYSYTSTNNDVATVANGKVNAVGVGTADIKVTASYLDFQTTKSITITVEPNVTFMLDKDNVILGTLEVDEYKTSAEVIASVYEGSLLVENPNIIWESSNEDIVLVENGILTAVGTGEAVVTAVYVSLNGDELIITLPVSVVRPVITTDFEGFIELNSSQTDKVSLELNELLDDELVGIFDATDEEIDIPFELNNTTVSILKSKLICGERQFKLMFEDSVKMINVKVVTKIIRTAEELLSLQSYSPNVKSYTWSKWSDETTENSYDGYFVLGNHIDLGKTKVKVTNHKGSNPARIWDNDTEAAGFNGTFDGCGYTIYGGNYDQGGLFGYLWKDGVIKNVAFVNAKINNTSSSCVIGISLWGTLENVLIQVSENNVPNGEIGVVAMSNGATFATNNVIVYDDSSITVETAGQRSSFVNHPADGLWGSYTNTFVFTNYYVAQAKDEEGCPIDPIATSKTLVEAGVDVRAFGNIWDMTGDRAQFANSYVSETIDMTGEIKAQYDMSSDSTFELTLPELDNKEVTKVTLNDIELDFIQDAAKLTFDSESYKASKQHGLVELKIECTNVSYLVNVLNITKVITTAEELLNLQSYSPNVKSHTWTIWSDETTENGYDGYFVLGNNIDLGSTIVKVTNHTGTNPARIWYNAAEAAGFNGTLDGCGYTISGGVYSQGGLFGYLWKDSVVKNVAFVDVTISNTSLSSLLGISVWGTLDNVLIQISENNVSDGEIGAVAMNSGPTFVTNNVIVYDDSALTTETAGKRSSFVNHASDGLWGTYTNTYVFTNYYVAQAKDEEGCLVDPIATTKSLVDAGVDVSTFGDIWDMSGDRATFKSCSIEND